MKSLRFLLLLAAGLSPVFSRAEPVTLPREQAFKLCRALEKVAGGLAPAKTIAAAENINALAPIADAVEKGSLRMSREQLRVPESPDRTEKTIRIAEDFDAACEKPVTVDLTLFTVSEDEIKEAKIAPALLAPLLRWLKPKKAP